jgi:diguanylate cyclase (GGDEF)-like protein
MALLFIDLDDFKAVNDQFGHNQGDRVLQILAQRLSQSLRAEDTVARPGSDEFIVLLAHLESSSQAAVVAAKILNAVEAPIEVNDRYVSVTASIGIATYPDNGSSFASLLRNADIARERSGASGTNSYRFSPASGDSAAAEDSPARSAEIGRKEGEF